MAIASARGIASFIVISDPVTRSSAVLLVSRRGGIAIRVAGATPVRLTRAALTGWGEQQSAAWAWSDTMAPGGGTAWTFASVRIRVAFAVR